MRRVVTYVLIGLGCFLLALAPLLRFYVYPSLREGAARPVHPDGVRRADATFLDIGALELARAET